jgi:hypothetical protein
MDKLGLAAVLDYIGIPYQWSKGGIKSARLSRSTEKLPEEDKIGKNK